MEANSKHPHGPKDTPSVKEIGSKVMDAAGTVADEAKLLRVPVPDNVPAPPLNRKVRSLELKQFICGAIAGGVAQAAVSPLRTLKMKAVAGSDGSSVWQVAGRALQDEGLRKSIISVSPGMSIFMMSLNRGVQFYTFEVVKRWAKKHYSEDPKVLPLNPAVPVSSLAGAAAGLATTLAFHPLSVAGTHMGLQPGKYKGLKDALVKLVAANGASSVFKGLAPALLSLVPSAALNFYIFETIKERWNAKHKKKDVANFQSLVFGAIAGGISATLTYPLECARNQIIMSDIPMQATKTGGVGEYSNLVKAFSGILKKEGFKGLYRGFPATALEIVPLTAIGFMVYEASKHAFVAENMEDLDEFKG